MQAQVGHVWPTKTSGSGRWRDVKCGDRKGMFGPGIEIVGFSGELGGLERAENEIGTRVTDRLTHQTNMSHKADSGLMQVIQISSPTVLTSGLV